MKEYTWVSSIELDRLTDKLEQLNSDGWEVEHMYAGKQEWGVGGELRHYAVLSRRKK